MKNDGGGDDGEGGAPNAVGKSCLFGICFLLFVKNMYNYV
jgi:hypothetical protein